MDGCESTAAGCRRRRKPGCRLIFCDSPLVVIYPVRGDGDDKGELRRTNIFRIGTRSR